MLDENNSLLTALSEEEAAIVCGGTVTYTVNPDGTVTVNSLSSGVIYGQNLTVASRFTLGGAVVSPVSLGQTTSSTSASTDPNNPNAFVGLTPY